jgi:hypothetical protein
MGAGASAYQISARLRHGEWVIVLGDVLAVAGLPVTTRVREAAALLDMPGTVLGGPTAARRLGLMAAPERIYVAGQVNRRLPTGVTLVRGRLRADDVIRDGGWPMTSPARTVVDSLRLLPDDEALRLLDRARARGIREEVERKVAERRGMAGTPRLRRLLAS